MHKMKIGRLAAATNCKIETIRFYERKGLFPAPPRSAANYRLYDARHAERLRFIRQCRLLGMSLQEIRGLLNLRAAPAGRGGLKDMLERHCQQVASRIAELKALERQLRKLGRLS